MANSERREAYKKLIDVVVKKLDVKQFDFKDIAAAYPVLDYSLAYNRKDELLLNFLDEVLSQCKETKVLYLNPNLPIKDLLSSGKLDSFSKSVSTLILTDGDRPLNCDMLDKALADDLSVIIHDQRQKCIEELISYVGRLNRPYSLFVSLVYHCRKMINFSDLASGNVCKISIQHEQLENCKLMTNKDIEYPNLTHLSISGIKLDEQFLKKLNESTAKGKLPSIQHLTISGIYQNLCVPLSTLFKCQWPSLTHLDLSDTGLYPNDIRHICGSTHPQQLDILPKLEVLRLSDNIPDECFLKQQRQNLSSLTYQSISFGSQSCKVAKGYFKNIKELGILFPLVSLTADFMAIFREADFERLDSLAFVGRKCSSPGSDIDIDALCQSGILAKLQCLNLTGCNLRDKFSSLFCVPFPKMMKLVVKYCNCTSDDLRTLNEANDNGILPELKQLDLSENPRMGSLQNLFDLEGSHWNRLKSLNVQHLLSPTNDFKYLSSMVQEGRLNSIEAVNVSIGKDEFMSNSACWGKLREIRLKLWNVSCEEVVGSIADGVERKEGNLFPLLETVYIVSDSAKCSSDVKLRLLRCGIGVHFIL